MARYIGAKSKIARRFKDPIFGPDKTLSKKSSPAARRKGKMTEYAIQLQEKQKAKYTYGLLERQFRNLFEKAARRQGKTGDNLLKLLEARLDNAVYRLGLARTRAAARQMVSHKHIMVNNRVVNIPSFILKPGDIISLREKSKFLEAVLDSMKAKRNQYQWFEWDSESRSGKFVNYPEREEIPENIRENLIVEFYSKQ